MSITDNGKRSSIHFVDSSNEFSEPEKSVAHHVMDGAFVCVFIDGHTQWQQTNFYSSHSSLSFDGWALIIFMLSLHEIFKYNTSFAYKKQ